MLVKQLVNFIIKEGSDYKFTIMNGDTTVITFKISTGANTEYVPWANSEVMDWKLYSGEEGYLVNIYI